MFTEKDFSEFYPKIDTNQLNLNRDIKNNIDRRQLNTQTTNLNIKNQINYDRNIKGSTDRLNINIILFKKPFRCWLRCCTFESCYSIYARDHLKIVKNIKDSSCIRCSYMECAKKYKNLDGLKYHKKHH